VAEAEEPIGSLAQETAKLLRAIAAERVKLVGDERSTTDDDGADESAHHGLGHGESGEHICTTGWCPICQVVGYLQDHPEMVEQVTDTVTDAALQIGRALRDFLDKTMPPDHVTPDEK
jgi:hypothetical protein